MITTSKLHRFIDNILYYSLIFSLAHVFAVVIHLPYNFFTQIGVVLLLATCLRIVILKPFILITALAIIPIPFLAIHFFVRPILDPIIQYMGAFSQNITMHIIGLESVASQNIVPFWLVLVIIISAFTTIVLYQLKRPVWLVPIHLLFYFYYWYTYVDKAFLMLALFLLTFIILIGLNKYKTKRLFAGTSKSDDHSEIAFNSWFFTVLIYSLIAISLAYLLPKGPSIIQWTWLEQKIYHAFPFVQDMRVDTLYARRSSEATSFDFTMTGYQEKTNQLGGPVQLNPRIIMQVITTKPTYLRGNVRHIYNGQSWETISYPKETHSLITDFSNLSYESMQLYQERFLTITHQSLASTTLFSPYQPVEIRMRGGNKVEVTANDQLLNYPHAVYEGETYVVKYLEPLPFQDMVAKGANYKLSDLPNQSDYLRLPDDLITDRTRSLVDAVTITASTDYEKATAIESYLRSHFAYSLDVPYYPEHSDFVDYFLFESQEGYCTHFASTMAILLRIADIPSRYIEGYVVKERIDSNLYQVRLSHAHAWVEAFIEPVGWVTFEPTTSYPLLHASRSETDPSSESNELNGLNDQENENSLYDLDESFLSRFETDHHLSRTDPIPSKSSFDILHLMRYIFLLLFLSPLRYILGFIRFKIDWQRLLLKDGRTQIVGLYHYILNLSQLLGYPYESGETHLDFAKRVSHKLNDPPPLNMGNVTRLFVHYKYSFEMPTPDEVSQMKDYIKVLEKRLRNHLGLIVFYHIKYFKPKFLSMR